MSRFNDSDAQARQDPVRIWTAAEPLSCDAMHAALTEARGACLQARRVVAGWADVLSLRAELERVLGLPGYASGKTTTFQGVDVVGSARLEPGSWYLVAGHERSKGLSWFTAKGEDLTRLASMAGLVRLPGESDDELKARFVDTWPGSR